MKKLNQPKKPVNVCDSPPETLTDGEQTAYRKYVAFTSMALTEAQKKEFAGYDEKNNPTGILNPW